MYFIDVNSPIGRFVRWEGTRRRIPFKLRLETESDFKRWQRYAKSFNISYEILAKPNSPIAPPESEPVQEEQVPPVNEEVVDEVQVSVQEEVNVEESNQEDQDIESKREELKKMTKKEIGSLLGIEDYDHYKKNELIEMALEQL